MKEEINNKLIKKYRIFSFEPGGNEYWEEGWDVISDGSENPLASWVESYWKPLFTNEELLCEFFENAVEVQHVNVTTWYFKIVEID